MKNAKDERVRPEAGVRRRFGLSKVLLITAFFAVLFALLSCLDAHPLVFVGVAAFVTLVGLSQAILYAGKRPRRASIVTGAALGALAPSVLFICVLVTHGFHWVIDDIPRLAVLLTIVTTICAVIGAALGYVAGCLIAGIFLGKALGPVEPNDHPSEPPDPFRPDDPEIGPPDDAPEAR